MSAAPPTIAEEIDTRRISRVMHFTTNQGLLGILATGTLMSRTDLNEEDYLENICQLNAKYRQEDAQYLSYINMSITNINQRFFKICKDRWWVDSDFFWVALEFDPGILEHDGVLFATGNMGYRGMQPASGVEGFSRLFAPAVHHGFGSTTYRTETHADNQTTDPQAEVLYPHQLSTDHLTAVYAYDDENAASAEAACVAVGHRPVPILVRPEIFELGGTV